MAPSRPVISSQGAGRRVPTPAKAVRGREATIPARYTAPLLEAMHEHQPPWLPAVLAQAGLDHGALSDPDASLTMTRFDALMSAFARLTARDDLGFELGQRITLQHHGALGPVIQRCPTLDDVLDLLARYHRVVTPSFFLHYRRGRSESEFIWRPAAPMSPATLRAVEEIFAVSFHMQVAALLGERLRRYDVYLSMPAPAHAARYRALQPVRFHFGHLPLPEVRVVLDAAQLRMSLPPGAMVEPRSESPADLGGLQGSLRCPTLWSEWVAMMLREAEGACPSLQQLAGLLSMSPRSLTRRLAREGKSLHGLVKEVRHRRACEMLAGGAESITQIAYRLGYADPTNFSHAFRAMSGMSPRAYRAATSQASSGPAT